MKLKIQSILIFLKATLSSHSGIIDVDEESISFFSFHIENLMHFYFFSSNHENLYQLVAGKGAEDIVDKISLQCITAWVDFYCFSSFK